MAMDGSRANQPENTPRSSEPKSAQGDSGARGSKKIHNEPDETRLPHHSRTSADGIELAPGVRVASSVLGWSYASASGPGGQNVNRRSTKAVLRLHISEIPILPGARRRLCALAKGWLVHDGDELVIASDEHRSQSRNRQACLDRLRELLVCAMVVPKRRIATKPGRGAKERRLRAKREQSQKKERRRKKPDQE